MCGSPRDRLNVCTKIHINVTQNIPKIIQTIKVRNFHGNLHLCGEGAISMKKSRIYTRISLFNGEISDTLHSRELEICTMRAVLHSTRKASCVTVYDSISSKVKDVEVRRDC